MIKGEQKDFCIAGDGPLLYHDWLCVRSVGDLRKLILDKAHNSRYTIHPGATKMYQNLKQFFWWLRMKRYIAKFLAKCLTCQKVKIEHQKLSGLLQPLEIPEWKWDSIAMDFVMGLPRTTFVHNGIWVIADRLTKSTHFLAIRATYSLDKLAQLYVNEIV